MNTPSKPIDFKERPKRQRYDSLGSPESPFRIMIWNLAKRSGIIVDK